METPEGWLVDDGSLIRVIRLKDYKGAIAMVFAIGVLAEEQQHHPDLHVTGRSLRVVITTHEAEDTITDKDIALAEAINKLAAGIAEKP